MDSTTTLVGVDIGDSVTASLLNPGSLDNETEVVARGRRLTPKAAMAAAIDGNGRRRKNIPPASSLASKAVAADTPAALSSQTTASSILMMGGFDMGLGLEAFSKAGEGEGTEEAPSKMFKDISTDALEVELLPLAGASPLLAAKQTLPGPNATASNGSLATLAFDLESPTAVPAQPAFADVDKVDGESLVDHDAIVPPVATKDDEGAEPEALPKAPPAPASHVTAPPLFELPVFPVLPTFIPEVRPGVGQWNPPPTPVAVKVVENWIIPLPGGTRLSARVWLPKDALAGSKFPAILEFIPYRKRDFTAHRDEIMHPFFASRGYVSVRCDMRGTGDSTGTLEDEYTAQELEDAIAVIKYISSAPWCTGSVGMMGKSWGGFNSLQVAYLQPQELKAIVTVCSTDDRYADDIHHLGGCLLTDNLTWSGFMLKHCPLPPDPSAIGASFGEWRKVFRHRIINTSPWIITWLKHQRRDWYYKHGSIAQNYANIEVPVFCVGGWADSYTRPIFNMMESLKVPRKALVGPWAHLYPHQGTPLPAMNFLEECVRWWDEWLKGKKTGIMDEASCQVYLQFPIPTTPLVTVRPGAWIGLKAWPSPQIESRGFAFGKGTLGKTLDGVTKPTRGLLVFRRAEGGEDREGTAGAGEEVTVSNDLRVGKAAPRFCAFGGDPEMAGNQVDDDAIATCFDSEPLTEQLCLLGAPEFDVKVKVNKKAAIIVVRLCDVDPVTQESFLIGWAPFNLTHRDSHSTPEPLPGDLAVPVTARIRMKHVSHVLQPGRVLRVAFSTSYWPLVWPAAEIPDMRLVLDGCGVTVPVLVGSPGPSDDDGASPESKMTVGEEVLSQHLVERSRGCQPKPFTILRCETPGQMVWSRDGTRRYWLKDYGATRFDTDGWMYGETSQECYTLRAGDPLSAAVECRYRVECGRPDQAAHPKVLATLGLLQAGGAHPLADPSASPKDGEDAGRWKGVVRIDSVVRMTCTADEFCVEAELRAYENGRVVGEQRWEDVRVKRDLV
ncbi:hypothetical protein HDU96_008788 [Phlyctochytrium bullatum]|nr:hypothetical protein HDU96_008788 [Phlyctochytrium bullatum]